MGFWQTGYYEFHEPHGLGDDWEPAPVRLSCPNCGEIFESADELRRHRFAAHPLRRPTMFLEGRELGTQRIKITRPVSPTRFWCEGAERATLNDRAIALAHLANILANASNDVWRIVLEKEGVYAHFELEIRIASDEDLQGVEDQFARMAKLRRLDARAVEQFIAGASRFTSAIGYCDGICAYLYGLMAKERVADCSLPYKTYVEKFAKAADELSPYDRPLAKTIGALIAFHFNHFKDAQRLSPSTRLGDVAARFANWTDSRAVLPPQTFSSASPEALALERLVTDSDTEQILDWGRRPLADLTSHVNDIEQYLNRDLAEFDRVKLHVLLGETFAKIGSVDSALKHAKAMRNLRQLESWSEALVRALGDDK